MCMAAAVWASTASPRRQWSPAGHHSVQQSLERSLVASPSQLQLLPQLHVGLASLHRRALGAETSHSSWSPCPCLASGKHTALPYKPAEPRITSDGKRVALPITQKGPWAFCSQPASLSTKHAALCLDVAHYVLQGHRYIKSTRAVEGKGGIPTSLRAAWSSFCAKAASEPPSPTEGGSSRPAEKQCACVMEALQAISLQN